MNDPISWDPSLVKKFSSSNHYKLLNQLRNEVKKYPLNYKKNDSSIHHKDINLTNKNKTITSQIQDTLSSNNPTQSNDMNANKSTVSFNNSKNFSIYNKTNNSNQHNEIFLHDQTNTHEEPSSPTFKERLNQIDLK